MDSQQQPQIEHTFENPITPHRKINWLFVILAVIGFFAVLTTGYFLGTSSQKTKADELAAEPTPTEYIMPTAVAEPTRETVIVRPTSAPVDETAGWKKYNFKKIVSLKIPSNWEAFEFDDSLGNCLSIGDKETISWWKDMVNKSMGTDGPIEIIDLCINTDFTEKESNDTFYVKKEDINIDGHIANKYTSTALADGPGLQKGDKFIEIIIKYKESYIRFWTVGKSSKIISSFDQILSTFQFISQ